MSSSIPTLSARHNARHCGIDSRGWPSPLSQTRIACSETASFPMLNCLASSAGVRPAASRSPLNGDTCSMSSCGPKLSGNCSGVICKTLNKVLYCLGLSFGSVLPTSQLLTVCSLTPNASAKSFWVRPRRFLNLTIGDSKLLDILH